MKAYHNTAVLKFDDDTTGNAASGVPVTVKINSSQLNATIFDVDGVGIANPLTTDSNGNYAFKATDNIYDIIVSEGTANEVKLEKVEIAEIPTAPILINDLSQAYEFATVAALTSGAIVFPSGKVIDLLDRGASFIFTIGGTANGIDILDAGNGNTAIYADNGVFVASQCGATHDSADSAAILNHIMTKSNYVIDGAYSVASSLVVNTNTSGDMQGSEITALTDNFDVLTGNSDSKFEMIGNLKLIGAGNTGTGKGVNFFDCFDYKIDCNIDVSEFETGIFCDGTTVAAGLLGGHRGRQGRWTNPTAHNNQNGIQVLRRAEYTLWSNPQSTQNTVTGWINTAGNTNVVGGNIQDNQNGVLLQETGTSNANHGMFSSVNINHNIGYNIRAEDTEYGHTFNGCHIYGDSASAGTIELIGSSGINITDGIIDAKIVIDGLVTTPTAAVTGWNRISGNQVDENFSVFDSTNNGREQTIVTDNFQRNGDAWGFNDRAFVEARATAETSTQTLPSNTVTTILFPTEKSDNRNYYNTATGSFTSEQSVNMQVEFNFQVVISGGTFVDGFVAVYVNGTPQALSGLIAVNTANTSLVSNGSLTLALQPSDTVTIRANVESTGGTITVGADSATNVSFVSSN